MVFTIFIYAALSVAVSIAPLKGIVEEVGGHYFTYHVVYPEGANPHLYEPKPSDILKVKKATIFIYSGKAEPGGKRLCAIAKKCIRLEDLVKRENPDPHIWLSPKDVYLLMDTLAVILASLEPSYKDTFLKRAESVKTTIDSLMKVHRVYRQEKRVLLMHRAFAPLFKQLGYKVEVVAKEPGVEPGASVLKVLIHKATDQGFVLGVCEEKRPCKILKMVASNANFPIISLNPLYDTSFTSFLKDALRRIENATHSGK